MNRFYKALFIVIMIFSLIAVAYLVSSSSPSKAPQSDSIPAAYVSSSAKIPSGVVEYLKKAPKYANYYGANKKFAIYYTGANCPYGAAFSDSVKNIASDPSYQQSYYFLPIDISQMGGRFANREEAQNDIDFNKLCHEFCIVNPVKNELFFIDGVGEEEAAKVPTIFSDLKNW